MSLDILTDWLSQYPAILQSVYLLGAILLSAAAYYIAKPLIIKALTKIIKRSPFQLDDILLQEGVFHQLIHIIPVLILYNAAHLVPGFAPVVERILAAVMAWIILLALGAFLSAAGIILKSTDFARRLNLKSYIQIVKLILYILGTVVIISILIGKSPGVLLTGVGALTAVLILVFRDTILSFVASLQISSNNLVRVGDWIEMPTFGADGDVIDIALHTIKVQNWDKTITTIPTHKLLEHSIKNWRGMSESGGRRIKRSIYIDMSTIRHCDEAMLERFRKIRHITGYIEDKLAEVSAYNEQLHVTTNDLVNGRWLTNVGTFRAYVEAYLRHHPHVHQGLTLMVRQLSPGPSGLPIEIYCFTNTTDWVRYEAIQADIFDHILAIVPEFGLKVFQEPTGGDFRRLGRGSGSS